jgi:hypothetical protein
MCDYLSDPDGPRGGKSRGFPSGSGSSYAQPEPPKCKVCESQPAVICGKCEKCSKCAGWSELCSLCEQCNQCGCFNHLHLTRNYQKAINQQLGDYPQVARERRESTIGPIRLFWGHQIVMPSYTPSCPTSGYRTSSEIPAASAISGLTLP